MPEDILKALDEIARQKASIFYDELLEILFREFMKGPRAFPHISYMRMKSKRQGTIRFATIIGHDGEEFENAVNVFNELAFAKKQLTRSELIDRLNVDELPELGLKVFSFSEFLRKSPEEIKRELDKLNPEENKETTKEFLDEQIRKIDKEIEILQKNSPKEEKKSFKIDIKD